MKRHCPDVDLMETAEKARVAVSSRGLASATAEGLRMTPARDTDMTEAVTVAVAGALADATGGDVMMAVVLETTSTAAEDDTDAVVLVTTVVIVVLGAGAGAAASPKVNDWFGSPVQVAMSMTLPVTAKQDPGWFSGVKASGPALPEKGKSCEFVTLPPPSARPPQENSRT